jgi:hypothetical protein
MMIHTTEIKQILFIHYQFSDILSDSRDFAKGKCLYCYELSSSGLSESISSFLMRVMERQIMSSILMIMQKTMRVLLTCEF